MRFCVLGSAAGGGFPQWNCGCSGCQAARRSVGASPGSPAACEATPRTQDSLAVLASAPAATTRPWLLVNASPDVGRQLERTAALHPVSARHCPIGAIVLTNGDVDHVLGLFSMRESYPLRIYATAAVRRGLERNVLLRTLQRFPGQLTFVELTPGVELDLAGADGAPLGLRALPVAAPGKLPVHLVADEAPSSGDNIALRLTDTASGRTLAYASAVARGGGFLAPLLESDALLFDGTFWSSDELLSPGLSSSSAEDMAHWPVGGPAGSLAALGPPPAAPPGQAPGRSPRRRIFTHINNTSPLLLEGSPQRAEVARAGWEIAFDGMEVTLA
jgi:pyrroloquinoline quinone biosynthesis protein B